MTNDINMTEIMLALGLKDRIAGVEDKGEVLPKYQEAFDKVPKISDEYLPSREALLGVEVDFLNIGRIFGVEDRAQELVEGYEKQVAEVESWLSSNSKPLRALVYDSGEEAPFTVGGEAIPNELIRLADGVNIFEDAARVSSGIFWRGVWQNEDSMPVRSGCW